MVVLHFKSAAIGFKQDAVGDRHNTFIPLWSADSREIQLYESEGVGLMYGWSLQGLMLKAHDINDDDLAK